MKHVLIVANQTAAGAHLKRTIQRRLLEGECRFTLVVPATQDGSFTWTEGQARTDAAERLERALNALRSIGASIDGVVGDPRATLAVDDAMRDDPADEIIVSTLPPGVSRWLRQDLPHRLARQYNVKVIHVVDSSQAAIA